MAHKYHDKSRHCFEVNGKIQLARQKFDDTDGKSLNVAAEVKCETGSEQLAPVPPDCESTEITRWRTVVKKSVQFAIISTRVSLLATIV